MKDSLQQLEKRIEHSKKDEISPRNILYISNINNISIELLSCIIVGLFLGRFFDNLFDSKPIFSILCIIFAIVAAVKSILKQSAN